jgi:hypothetical protein
VVVSGHLERMAREVLEGFGDANLGEWVENGVTAFHLRRRLTEAEKEGIGEAVACDITEGLRRFNLVAPELHPGGLALAQAELAERALKEQPI